MINNNIFCILRCFVLFSFIVWVFDHEVEVILEFKVARNKIIKIID